MLETSLTHIIDTAVMSNVLTQAMKNKWLRLTAYYVDDDELLSLIIIN